MNGRSDSLLGNNMRHLTRQSRLALPALLLMLSACGGGGGSPPPIAPPAPTFTVTVNVTGLAGSGLVLANNGGNALSVTANGTSTFTTALASGSTYTVTVQTQPSSPQQTCTVTNATGTISANVTNVTVNCVTGVFAVGATVSGLASGAVGLVVTNNGGDNEVINTNGAFVFDTTLASGSGYDIRVLSNPYDPYQSCRVQNGSGTVTSGAVNATITCTTLVPRFATSIDNNDSSYSQYAVDATTGQLRLRGYAKVGARPVDVGAYADGRISFVLSRGEGTLHAFVRDMVTGQLTEAPNSPASTGALIPPSPPITVGALGLTIHPRLNFVYVANGGGSTAADSIAAFSFNTTTGALSPVPGSPFAAGAAPIRLSIDPSGRFAYASNRDANSISSYSIDQATGALTSIGPAVPSGGPVTTFVAVHPTGKWLYMPLTGSTSSIAAFAIGANGALTAITGSPFAAPADLSSRLNIHPSGQYLYVNTAPTAGNSVVAGYRIDAATGALTQIGTPTTVDGVTQNSWMDASGRYLFVPGSISTNPSVGSVSVLRINAASGELTLLPGLSALTPSARYASLDWSGKFLYVASISGNSVRSFAFNAANGALTSVPFGGNTVSRDSPVTIVAIPSADAEVAQFASKFAYVPSNGEVSAFSINPTTGAYTARTGVAVASPAFDAAVLPNGGALIVATDPPSSLIATYPINGINGITGALSAATGSASGGTAPNGVVVDPSGRFAYVPDTQADMIHRYRRNASSGAFEYVSSFNTADAPLAVAMHPTGRFLYYITATNVGFREIDSADGTLSLINAVESITNGVAGKRAIAVSPDGRWIYVARTSGGGMIDVYSLVTVGVTAGQLSASGSVNSGGTDPASIAIDPTSQFMYVGHTTPAVITKFRINQSNGSLVANGTATATNGTPVVRADYSGKFLHVVDNAQLHSFAINAATGELTAVPTGAPTAASPNNLALSEDVQ